MILRRITARQDPRWLPFLRKLGRASEQLAKIAFTAAVPPGSCGAPHILNVSFAVADVERPLWAGC